MNIFLLLCLGVAGFFLLLYGGFLLYRGYLRHSTKITTAHGISVLEAITLGGLPQWIFIRGTDQTNPVLLFLHGGPGAPLLGMSSSRKYDANLINHFTVVHWDQRGAGKSFNREIPVESMTLDRFVEDCKELIDYLRNRFHADKVFLVGHSSGSVLGLKTAHRYPEKLHAYIGVAQIINEYAQQQLTYEFILEEAVKAGDASRQKAITAIGPPPYDSPKQFLEQAGHVVHYGGFLRDKSITQYFKMGKVMFNFLTSPEYSLAEGIRTFRNKGLEFTINAMWEELKTVNLAAEIPSINVPIYFFEGKYDMTTPTAVVEQYFDALKAEKGKQMIMFEHSGHLPMIEEKERYEELLIAVLKDRQSKKFSGD
jgi:pimeloyl-ACP methyl ester carboxylesterase